MLTRNATRLSVNQLEDRLAPAAQFLDLTTAGAFGGVRGAIFAQFSGGKANVDTFLSMDTARGGFIEQGINTVAVQFDEIASHAIRLSELPKVTIGGVQYAEFVLDVGESHSNPQVSLDDLKVFAGPVPNLAGLNLTTASLNDLPAVYNLDGEALEGAADPADWRIELDASLSNKGKVTGTMLFYLPVSVVVDPTGREADPYVYLYSRFGLNSPADGKAESWSHGNVLDGPVSPSTAGTLDASGLFTSPTSSPTPPPPSDETGGDTGGDDGGVWL